MDIRALKEKEVDIRALKVAFNKMENKYKSEIADLNARRGTVEDMLIALEDTTKRLESENDDCMKEVRNLRLAIDRLTLRSGCFGFRRRKSIEIPVEGLSQRV